MWPCVFVSPNQMHKRKHLTSLARSKGMLESVRENDDSATLEAVKLLGFLFLPPLTHLSVREEKQDAIVTREKDLLHCLSRKNHALANNRKQLGLRYLIE